MPDVTQLPFDDALPAAPVAGDPGRPQEAFHRPQEEDIPSFDTVSNGKSLQRLRAGLQVFGMDKP